MQTNKSNKISVDSSERLNLRVEIEKYLRYWKWFVLGSFVSLVLAILYIRYSAPLYVASASILIKDNKKSGLSAELEAFKDLGIVGGSSINNTDNEVEILKSRKIIGNAVEALGLDVSYIVSGRVTDREVYKSTSPIRFEFVERDSLYMQADTIFKVKINDDFSFNLSSQDEMFTTTHQFNEIIEGRLGKFKIVRQEVKDFKYSNVQVNITPRFKLVSRYGQLISIAPANKNSSVLKLALKGPVRQKAEDVLNELVRQYNIDGINDKNEVSRKTIEFINARIDTIGKQLSIIQDNVERFKKDKDFIGLPVEVQIALESLKEMNENIINSQIQLSLAEAIESKLSVEEFNYELLPASLGFDDKSITQLILSYNDLVLERNKVKLSAGSKNLVLLQIEDQIKSSRASLLGSINNIVNSLKMQLNDFRREEQKVLSRVKSMPSNERGFIDIARKQEITSGLYQYLLKKKEETDISLAVTVPNAKIIDVAYSSNIPVSPKRKIIYLAALLIGFIVPFGIIYVVDLLDTKIHNKQDVESELSVPFLGDVPKSDSKEKVVIGNDIRSSTAEAFRLIRTNLDFMLTSNRKESKAIFVTSTTSGEGKSFISINLAATLALSGKKVLLMGMDLRAPKVTEYLGIPERKGVTNYITDEDMLLEDIIFQIPQIKGLDIIASGVIPPNPAELLMTKRVENLFTIVKQEYDFVLVDTAPVNLVTDTLLVSKYADMVMYVVRANYLDKRLLAVPQELYNDKKLPNMAIVLNDTDPKRSYGYGYGGYGYGYVVVDKPWYKKIFDRS